MPDRKLFVLLAAFTVLAVATTVGIIATIRGDDPEPRQDYAAPPAPTATPTLDVPAPSPEPRPADLRMVRSSCEDDWPVVLQPGSDGTRLVAEARIANRGDRQGRTKVVATWLYFGGGSATTSKVVTVAPGQRVRVPLSLAVPQAEALRMVGHQHGDRMCRLRLSAAS